MVPKNIWIYAGLSCQDFWATWDFSWGSFTALFFFVCEIEEVVLVFSHQGLYASFSLFMTLKYIHYLFICLLPLLNYSDSQAIESLNLYVLFQNKNFPNVSDCISHDFNQTHECWRIGWPRNIKMWVGIEISVTKSLYQLASRKEYFSSSL